jgi:hypothetical protein
VLPTGSDDTTVHIWVANSDDVLAEAKRLIQRNPLLLTPVEHSTEVTSVAFSPDGNMLARRIFAPSGAVRRIYHSREGQLASENTHCALHLTPANRLDKPQPTAARKESRRSLLPSLDNRQSQDQATT